MQTPLVCLGIVGPVTVGVNSFLAMVSRPLAILNTSLFPSARSVAQLFCRELWFQGFCSFRWDFRRFWASL
eukprot:15469988-Alexandrium_andersonii.AAC.1